MNKILKKLFHSGTDLLFGPDLGGAVGKPRVLQFPINDICNSRCQMCDIWKRKKEDEVTPEQLRVLIRDDLYSELEAVGINGGEPTLRRDVGDLVRVLVEELPSLKSISLITNAYSVKRVIAGIEAIGHACDSRLGNPVKLDVMVSIDGVGEVHNRVRGRKDNFLYAEQVIDFALESDLVDSTRIGCTVIRENVFDVENVLAWAQQKGVYARFRLGVPHQRLGSDDGRGAFDLNYEEKFHFCNFLDCLVMNYESKKARQQFYRSLRNQIAYGMARSVGCAFQTRGATLLPKGELAFCAVESKTLGSVIDGGQSNDLYFSNLKHLEEIKLKKCAGCQHDYEALPSKAARVQRIRQRLVNKFDKTGYFSSENQASRFRRLLQARKLFSQRAKVNLIPNSGAEILLCGWYGTETLGDKAILAGVVKVLRAAFESPRITVCSIEPYISDHTHRQMSELEGIESITFEESKLRIRQKVFNGVFMAGGPLMSAVNYCLEVAELFASARSVGLITGVLGCGIGPLYGDKRDDFVKAIIEFSSISVFRDQKSLQLAKDFGFEAEATSVVDPAWWWLCDQDGVLLRDRNRVLFALRDWSIKEYGQALGLERAKSLKVEFEGQLIRAAEVLVEAGIEVVPFCMHKYAVGGDDRDFYRRLFNNFPEILKNLDSRHRKPSEDIRVFQECGAALTMRFHSCVFSLATNTPMQAIDYTLGGKVESLLAEHGESGNLNSIRDFNGEDVAKKMIRQLKQDEQLRSSDRQDIEDAFSRLVDKLKSFGA